MDLIERIMWPVEKDCGRWKRVVSDMVWVKMACTRAAKELSSTLLCSSHAIEWLGFEIVALGYAIAWVLA